MNTRMMNAICKEFGIKFYSFLQPCMWIGQYVISDREKDNLNLYMKDKKDICFYEEVVKNITNYDYIFNMTDIFNGMSGIYYDSCHVNEEGNQIIAKKIFETIYENCVV